MSRTGFSGHSVLQSMRDVVAPLVECSPYCKSWQSLRRMMLGGEEASPMLKPGALIRGALRPS